MAIVELAASIRQGIGKQANRRAKHEGRIPGVIYGKGIPSRNLEFERRPLEKYLSKAKHGTVIVKMSVADGDATSESFAVLKEFQFHPVTDSVIHIDFYEVAAGKKFNVEVPLRVKGKAPGIEFGGILEVLIRSLEIRCLPDNVPEYIDLDVTGLNLGETLHLGDLVFPDGVKPVEKDSKMAIAAVHAPKEEAVKAAAEGTEDTSVAAAAPAKKGKG